MPVSCCSFSSLLTPKHPWFKYTRIHSMWIILICVSNCFMSPQEEEIMMFVWLSHYMSEVLEWPISSGCVYLCVCSHSTSW